jgi:Saxitoxin biosynthesis operon protein SxtJ
VNGREAAAVAGLQGRHLGPENSHRVPAGLHENFERAEDVRASSDRSFGFVFAGFFALVAIVRWWRDQGGAPWFALAGLAMLAIALIRPSVLAPFNRLWTKLALLLSRIMNPVIMGVLFFLVVMPIGLVMRVLGKRPLALEMDREAKSYWIERAQPAPLPGSMKNQF